MRIKTFCDRQQEVLWRLPALGINVTKAENILHELRKYDEDFDLASNQDTMRKVSKYDLASWKYKEKIDTIADYVFLDTRMEPQWLMDLRKDWQRCRKQVNNAFYERRKYTKKHDLVCEWWV
jgi:hypothetical protein